MEQQQLPQQTPREGVNWGAVLGGIVLAFAIGIISGVVGAFAGMALTPETGAHPNYLPFIMGGGFVAALLALGVTWFFSRKRLPSFAKGIIVGGCMAVLISGFCNMLFGMMASSAGH